MKQPTRNFYAKAVTRIPPKVIPNKAYDQRHREMTDDQLDWLATRDLIDSDGHWQ